MTCMEYPQKSGPASAQPTGTVELGSATGHRLKVEASVAGKIFGTWGCYSLLTQLYRTGQKKWPKQKVAPRRSKTRTRSLQRVITLLPRIELGNTLTIFRLRSRIKCTRERPWQWQRCQRRRESGHRTLRYCWKEQIETKRKRVSRT